MLPSISGLHMPIDRTLVNAAIQQALTRFPSGYAGAAAIRTHTGQILTSVCFDAPNAGASLCHEAYRISLGELQPHYWRNAVIEAGE